jgi:hypothetical protein
MKFNVDDETIYELNETKQNVVKNEVHSDEFNEDIKRRVKYIVDHKYEQCFKRLKAEWEPKLKASGVKTIPLDEDEFAQLVFAQPAYKDRKTRDAEEANVKLSN